MDEQKKPEKPKLLTVEEFEKDQIEQKEEYEKLSKFDDFEKYKHMLPFNFMTYKEYLELYDRLYNIEEQDNENEKNNIEVNSIE